MRMVDVYAFTTRAAAEAYRKEFGYAAVVEVDVPSNQIVNRWQPAYANGDWALRIAGPVPVVMPPTTLKPS